MHKSNQKSHHNTSEGINFSTEDENHKPRHLDNSGYTEIQLLKRVNQDKEKIKYNEFTEEEHEGSPAVSRKYFAEVTSHRVGDRDVKDVLIGKQIDNNDWDISEYDNDNNKIETKAPPDSYSLNTIFKNMSPHDVITKKGHQGKKGKKGGCGCGAPIIVGGKKSRSKKSSKKKSAKKSSRKKRSKK